MPDIVQCDAHGEGEETFVCSHLDGEAIGLGFNRGEPSAENPFPDAWCDDCNVIYKEHDGWNEKNEGLVSLRLLCSTCYENVCIRNTRTDMTLDDLESLRWKCDSCEEWHTGAALDFGFDTPLHWDDNDEKANQGGTLNVDKLPRSFLNKDFCIIEERDYFVRGVIHLPIVGTAETFCWGVWGTLSKQNFEKLVSLYEDPKRAELPPMFSWLSNRLHDYDDDTLNLKMQAHIPEVGLRPIFELEPTDHPLSQEHHHGITPQRVKEIMQKHLKEVA